MEKVTISHLSFLIPRSFLVPLHLKIDKNNVERTLHHLVAHWQQHFHDFGLVRPLETPANEHLQQLAPVVSDTLLMGHRFLRIFTPSACQQNWLCGQWRPLFISSAEGDSRSCLLDCIHRHRLLHVSGRTPPLEPRSSLPLPCRSGLFRILEIREL